MKRLKKLVAILITASILMTGTGMESFADTDAMETEAKTTAAEEVQVKEAEESAPEKEDKSAAEEKEAEAPAKEAEEAEEACSEEASEPEEETAPETEEKASSSSEAAEEKKDAEEQIESDDSDSEISEEEIKEEASQDITLARQKIDADLDAKSGKIYENDEIILAGKMPEGGIVEAKRVNVKIGGEKALVAYDIKIYANEEMKELGNEWQPEKDAIRVTMKSDALNADKVNVYHMKDENSRPELVAEEVTVKNGSVNFEAESFSVYSVTDVTAKPRAAYTFYQGSTVLAAEYVTDIDEFYDPGVSPEYGQTFLGWAFDPAEEDEDKIYSFEQLKEMLSEVLEGSFEDGTEFKVYARFKEAWYLRYMVDEDGTVGILKSDSVPADAADKTRTVSCEYSGSDEKLQGWIDASTGTVYQNGDTITLNKHIDLYAKITGRCWLVFHANAQGATFTGPQLIYGDRVTQKPSTPVRKGYIFKGWNTKEDGSGTWWSRTDDSSVNRFGTSITEDTTLYAQWEGDENNYTVIYWKQKAEDEAGIPDEDKTYDYVESQTVTGVLTGDAVTLPKGYDKKAATDPESAYYQTVYGRTDDVSAVTVSADGSTVVNVYYDRRAYHLFFQDEYTVVTGDNDNSPSKYGDVNGSKARVYWNNGAFRTSNNRNATIYKGNIYIKEWGTVKDIYALYEHNISGEFPITGTNGITYNKGERWSPQANNQGWDQVMVLIDSMPAENVTFRLSTSSNTTKYMKYFVEALPGETPVLTYGGIGYVQYGSTVSANYNFVTEEDRLVIAGFRASAVIGGTKESDRNTLSLTGSPAKYTYNNNTATWVNFLYTRKTHSIDFVSQGKNVTTAATETVSNVPYGGKITDYMPAPPTNGQNGYYFDGWYKDPACTEGTEVTDADTMPDGNAIFYAKWSTYRVRVVLVPGCTDYQFANNQSLSFRAEYGESISFENVRPNVAARPGYRLTGWYTTPDFQEGTEVDTDETYIITNETPGVDMDYQSSNDWADNTYGDNDGAHGNVQGILKLYARWQLDIKEGAVYFFYEVEDGFCIYGSDGNKQTVIPVDPIGHAFNTSFQIAAAPEGYIDGIDFVNWMVLKKNGGATSVVYNPGDTVTLSENAWADYINTVTVTDSEGNVGTMKVVRMKARFTSKEDKATTIVFKGNGGFLSDGAEDLTQVVPLNATIDLASQSAAFSRPHFTIVSWNTQADGNGTSFRTNEEVYVNNDNLDENGANVLYAIWRADIEVVAAGPEEEAAYDGELHSSTMPYTFSYLFGGEEKTQAELEAMGLAVRIADKGWPVASGTEKGVYTSGALTDAQLAELIKIDRAGYHEPYQVKRVYQPAKLTIRDLMLTITKSVTGSASDSNKAFSITLESIEGVSGGTYHGTITRKIEGTTVEATFAGGRTFWMRDGDVVKIEGLPQGKAVTFSEDNGNYQTTWELNEEQVALAGSANITLSGDSKLVIADDLPAVAATGVTLKMMPYVLMVMAALAILFIRLAARRRNAA